MISTYGRVWQKYLGRFLRQSLDTKGYPCVILQTDIGPITCRVHRLVMLSFNYQPGCESLVVNHINSFRQQNYYPNNLEWVTQEENMRLAAESAFNNEKERVYNPTLEEQTVRKICEMLQDRKITLSEISKKCDVSYQTVQAIQQKRTYTYISKDYNIEPRKANTNFTPIQIRQICEYYQSNPQPMNMTQLQHAENALKSIDDTEITPNNVRAAKKILTRDSFRTISDDYDF
jgi:hypothetical protein